MSEFKTMPMEQIEALAADYLCEVVVAQPNQLQFDIDDDEGRRRFAHFYTVKLFARYGDKLPRQHWFSKSGNEHWLITLPEELDVVERIAMQAMGGSDPGREWAALCCHKDGSPHPVLLFLPLAAQTTLIEPIAPSSAPIETRLSEEFFEGKSE